MSRFWDIDLMKDGKSIGGFRCDLGYLENQLCMLFSNEGEKKVSEVSVVFKEVKP